MSRVVTAAGHPAQPWTTALAPLPACEPTDLLDLDPGDRLVVAVPHPDDETLAVGGILQRLNRAGVDVVVVLMTAGGASYGQTGEGACALGRIRLREFHEAMSALGLDRAEVHRLDLPDGLLAGYEREMIQALTEALSVDSRQARSSRVAVLAPWPKDPHPDHQAAGCAAGIAARRAGSLRWSYPLWMRHGLSPEDPGIPWPDIRRIALSAPERDSKRNAIQKYASQLAGPTADVGPVLPPHVVEHFTDGHELLIRPVPGDDEVGTHFDALYEGNEDPWRAESWYERRKRTVLLASLPRERYQLAWEPGCSLGNLSAELAARCDRLLASDISPRAIAVARERVVSEHVTFDVAQVPAQPPDIPPESCDLVVLSEFLYYLPDRARAATIELAVRLLRPGGHLVVVHWRDHPADAHCSGEQANREATAALAIPLVHHVDEHFVLDVLAKDAAPADRPTREPTGQRMGQQVNEQTGEPV